MNADINSWQEEYAVDWKSGTLESTMLRGSVLDGDYSTLGDVSDFFPEEQQLSCALFRWPGMDPNPSESPFGHYSEFFVRGLLITLKQLSFSPSTLLRNADITIWTGDAFYLTAGFPYNTHKQLATFLLERFSLIRGYDSHDKVDTPQIALSPRFRYAAGTIIVYEDESVAGRIMIDGSDNFGTGAELHYRSCVRSFE